MEKLENTPQLYQCQDCGELCECFWECSHCESDDLQEYVEE